MHDDFLHRLRKEPSREFAGELRARLRRHEAKATRSAPSMLRTVIVALLLGGAAFATTYVFTRSPVPDSYHPLSTRKSESLRVATVSPSSATSGATTVGVSPANAVVPFTPAASLQRRVVSSWAAYPYAQSVAERVNRELASRAIGPIGDTAPAIAVRDSEQWRELMCRSGQNGPAVAYAFRAVPPVSGSLCGPVDSGRPLDIVGIRVGYEVVLLARSRLYGALDLTPRDVYLALARWVPDLTHPGGVLENTSTTWQQVDPTLPSDPIEFIGPPPDSATGRSMIDLLIERGCDTTWGIAAIRSSDPERHARICRSMRRDGIYHEVSDSAGVAIRTQLLTQPNAIGVLGFDRSLLDGGDTQLSMSRLDAVEPSRQAIESGEYPGAGALYLYIDRTRARSDATYRLLINQSLLQVLVAGANGQSALLPVPEPERRAAINAALAH